ncbi:septum formation family protein [Streptomyces sp. NPDC048002]|uniref:serine/threonine-protein kinase n=1 Tax=Streptomyces sp. NPDC048002 TaxID=3154344 RepID=UPI0033FD470C
MPSGAWTSGVGRVVAGRYLLLHRLGAGGRGPVWLAHDRSLVCEVVLKEIAGPGPLTGGPPDHPHVVTALDVLEHEGRPWIATEYVAGAVALRDLVGRHGPLAPAECARVGLAVLDALSAGHEQGIAHGDVQPAKVLLAPDRTGAPHGRVLLDDYGVPGPPDAGTGPAWTRGRPAPGRVGGGPPGPAADLFGLGCTLYFAAEGRAPFAGEPHAAADEPPPAAHAGALAPLVRALLARDPALRPSVAEAHAALSRVLVPQGDPHGRPRTDPESQPQWAVTVPPPSGPRHARRRMPRTALAGLLSVALVAGGVWYAVADQAGAEKSAPPYGAGVGLARPLQEGDCVLTDWPGTVPFHGTPRLTLDPSCADRDPDGQVVALMAAGSAERAPVEGQARCEELTRELRSGLADVRALAVVPTEAGFEAAGRRTACLVLGAHGPLYGPLGGHREPGTAFADTATMQRRDCLDVRSNGEARLVSCAGTYDEQVLGFTRLGQSVTLAEARTASGPACAREVPPRDYGFDPSVYAAGSRTSPGPWKSGTHFVVCTVRKQNGGTMEGDEP